MCVVAEFLCVWWLSSYVCVAEFLCVMAEFLCVCG